MVTTSGNIRHTPYSTPAVVPDNGDQRRISDERRISEQEARIVFCQMLDQKNSWHYSVETPTIFKFQFKGITRELSARTDMALYGEDESRCK